MCKCGSECGRPPSLHPSSPPVNPRAPTPPPAGARRPSTLGRPAARSLWLASQSQPTGRSADPSQFGGGLADLSADPEEEEGEQCQVAYAFRYMGPPRVRRRKRRNHMCKFSYRPSEGGCGLPACLSACLSVGRPTDRPLARRSAAAARAASCAVTLVGNAWPAGRPVARVGRVGGSAPEKKVDRPGGRLDPPEKKMTGGWPTRREAAGERRADVELPTHLCIGTVSTFDIGSEEILCANLAIGQMRVEVGGRLPACPPIGRPLGARPPPLDRPAARSLWLATPWPAAAGRSTRAGRLGESTPKKNWRRAGWLAWPAKKKLGGRPTCRTAGEEEEGGG